MIHIYISCRSVSSFEFHLLYHFLSCMLFLMAWTCQQFTSCLARVKRHLAVYHIALHWFSCDMFLFGHILKLWYERERVMQEKQTGFFRGIINESMNIHKRLKQKPWWFIPEVLIWRRQTWRPAIPEILYAESEGNWMPGFKFWI